MNFLFIICFFLLDYTKADGSEKVKNGLCIDEGNDNCILILNTKCMTFSFKVCIMQRVKNGLCVDKGNDNCICILNTKCMTFSFKVCMMRQQQLCCSCCQLNPECCDMQTMSCCASGGNSINPCCFR